MMGVLSRPRPGQNRRYAYGFASTLARNTSQVGYPNHTHFIGQTHGANRNDHKLLKGTLDSITTARTATTISC